VTIAIRELGPSDAAACDAIVHSLPYHFGLEIGRAEAARAVRGQQGLVAEQDGEVVGFCTFVPRFATSAEITWMAVAAARRRRGIGHALIDRLSRTLAGQGYRVLCVLTVSPNDRGEEPEDGYQSTRRFYEKVGFTLVRDLPGEWDGGDTAVLLAMPLSG
jgi:ribosomal protein S18 acetylase RimI-like enzyme